jgi:hypothetical protein
MSHDATARAEAAVDRWAPASPAPELLEQAGGGIKVGGGRWVPVRGAHLRVVRQRQARNKTGVVGISLSSEMRRGRRVRVLWVQLGSRSRKIYVDRLGPTEAWRRAIALRAEHERRIAAANRLILAARERAAA